MSGPSARAGMPGADPSVSMGWGGGDSRGKLRLEFAVLMGLHIELLACKVRTFRGLLQHP